MNVWKTLKTGSGGLLIAAAFHQVRQQLKGTNLVDVISEDCFAGLKGILVTGVTLGKTTRRCGPSKYLTLRQAMAKVYQMLTTDLDYYTMSSRNELMRIMRTKALWQKIAHVESFFAMKD
jgi:hypothetical protein